MACHYFIRKKNKVLILLMQKLFLSFDYYACLYITSQYLLDISRFNNENLKLLGNSNYRLANIGLQPPAESSSANSMTPLSAVSYNKLPSKSQQVKSKSHFLTPPKASGV